MRKSLVLGMVFLLALAVFGIAGCGGDTKQAQQYMKTADDAYAAVQKQLDQLQVLLTPVLGGAVTGDYSKLTTDVVSQAQAIVNQAIQDLPAVAVEYKKIDSLKGVDDYKAYADAMVKVVDADIAAIAPIKPMLDTLAPMVQAGDTAGISAYFAQNTQKLIDSQQLSDAATKALAAAQDIKTEKKLGE